MNIQNIISEYKLRPFGVKGWMKSRSLPCPWCGKDDKFGIILNANGKSSYNCFHGSCGEKGPIQKLWKKIGRLDLLSKDETVQRVTKLENQLLNTSKTLHNTEAEEIKLPLGFKSIKYDPYLDKRGFLRRQYSIFNVGTCIDPNYKHHLIFLIKENGKCVGFLGRTRFSKQWHAENLKKAKKGECTVVPRYQNASGVDFEKFVGGYDEIIQNETHTVIVVEGLMDKQNVDKQLNLYLKTDLKCVFTFGNSISETQIIKLYNKGVKLVYLMYDYKTIKQSQQFGLEVQKLIECKICEINTPDKDPGDMTANELQLLMDTSYSPLNYKINKLPESLLKI